MDVTINILRAAGSLKNMVLEMQRKELELGRITKAANMLMMAGISENSIPECVVERCLREQNSDGGWIGIVDTVWNIAFLKRKGAVTHGDAIRRGLDYIEGNREPSGLWGRSRRDMSRIPVTGMLLYLLPEMGSLKRLGLLEELWFRERNSLTYKAAYTLMAFRRHAYRPEKCELVKQTVEWLVENQRKNGGYAPWREHPVPADVFCTGTASIGLLQYPEWVPATTFERALNWLTSHQLRQGIWAFHEIEDGAAWGLLAMKEMSRFLD